MGIESLLSRLAGESSWRTECSGGAFGGLSKSDIAYTLSGMQPHEYAYARAKYLHSVDKIPDLLNWVLENSPENKRKFELARLAILETICPRLCPACAGKGIVYGIRGVVSNCQTCQGSGKKAYSDAERAQLVGLHRSGWKRVWSDRYSLIYRRLQSIDNDVNRHIRLRLGKNL